MVKILPVVQETQVWTLDKKLKKKKKKTEREETIELVEENKNCL